MSEVVERIAKKVAEIRRCELGCWNCGFGCICYIDAHSLVSEFLREPADAMIGAVCERFYSAQDFKDMWRCAMDEVLK